MPDDLFPFAVQPKTPPEGRTAARYCPVTTGTSSVLHLPSDGVDSSKFQDGTTIRDRPSGR